MFFMTQMKCGGESGNMPENNPLHMEMRVREYLKFRARLKGLGRSRRGSGSAPFWNSAAYRCAEADYWGNFPKGTSSA
jgi:hypothetical protein